MTKKKIVNKLVWVDLSLSQHRWSKGSRVGCKHSPERKQRVAQKKKKWKRRVCVSGGCCRKRTQNKAIVQSLDWSDDL